MYAKNKTHFCKLVRKISLFIVGLIIILSITLPLVSLIIISLRSERSLVEDSMRIIPQKVYTGNYQAILTGLSGFLEYESVRIYVPRAVKYVMSSFWNSIWVSSGVVLLSLACANLYAYAISRLKSKGRGTFIYSILSLRMIPPFLLIIPLYVMLRSYGLLSTRMGIILALAAYLLPYAILLLVNYFVAFPKELEEAARIDGCTRLGAFFRIVLPLTSPAITAVSVIIFLLSWQEFLLPLVVLSSEEKTTLPVIIALFSTDTVIPVTLIAAVGVLTTTPTIVLALAMQKFIIRGLTAGAVKG